MAEYLSLIIQELGISVWLFTLIVVWSFVWKLLAMWKSARKGSLVWFLVIAFFNTIGILPILYYFVFSEMKCCKKKPVKKKSD